MDTKLDRWEKKLDEKLTNLIVRATHVEEHGNSQHNEPRYEETSQLGEFSHHQPPFGPHSDNPHSMDNNTWNRFPKVDLNKFNGLTHQDGLLKLNITFLFMVLQMT